MGVTQLQGQAAGVGAHSALTGLGADDHAQYLLLAGRASGQSAFGGTGVAEELVLQGSTDALRGRVRFTGPVTIAVNGVGDQTNLRFDDTFTTGGTYVGGALTSVGTVTYNSAVSIFATFTEGKQYNGAVSPGFAAYTVMNVLPVIQNSGNFDLVSGLAVNVGITHRRVTSGTSVVANTTGLNFAARSGATVSGAVLTKTLQIAVSCSPTWDTASGSTVNLGTVIGLQCNAPSQALFGSSAGAENLTAYIGLMMNAIPLHGNVPKEAVRSALLAASNSYFLRNIGTARSSFGSSNIEFNDLFGCVFGTSQDLNFAWAGGTNSLFMQFNTSGFSDQLHFSNPSNGRILFQGGAGAAAVDEMNFNVSRFSLGAQSGAVGNQVGVFVTPARTASIGGEWSDFLLTQAGNITVNAALSLVAGWTINAPSITIGTGSVTTAAGLNIGGNPTGATNRIGVRIISNPTGGGGVNAALWVTAGRCQFDGFIDINKPIALGGGAAATLGNIGGSGPTTAAQAQWIEIEVNGVRHWIPAWT